MLSNDANPFAGFEPNTAADREDPGDSISLEQQRELQGLEVCSEVTKTRQFFHRHGLDWD